MTSDGDSRQLGAGSGGVGRGEAKIGFAQAASDGTIASSDLLVRPLLRTTELLEAVPGMIAAHHSGAGKANQYFLGGFNVYGRFYDWSMFSNPTYANSDGSSAQIHQFDRRWIAGLKAQRTWRLSDQLELRLGTEDRYDDIGKVGVVHTDKRVFVESFGLFHVKQASAAAFAEARGVCRLHRSR